MVATLGGSSVDRSSQYWQECVRLRPWLLRIAARRCVPPNDPDDVVHEAMVRGAVVDGLDLDRLLPFLTVLVKRLCADEFRRAGFARRYFNHPRLWPPQPVDPAEVVCDRAEAAWLQRRMHSLSVRDQKLVRLVADGLGHEQIAARLSTTSYATQSALHRIRRRLRRTA